MKKLPKIARVHIPKTGGTTLGGILIPMYKQQNLKIHRYRIKHIWHHFMDGKTVHLPKFNLQDIHHVSGHVPASVFIHLKKEGYKLITWIRDPIERARSHHDFMNESRLPHQPFLRKLCLDIRNGKATVVDIAHTFRNLHNFFMNCGIDVFDYIGVCEYYNQSLLQLGKVLEIDVNLNYKKKKVTKHKHTELTKKERDIIRKINKKDYQIYYQVVEKNRYEEA